jgi:nucleoside-diphosphate-sugar epimerase
VEDIVSGTLLAAAKEEAGGEIYNLGTGHETRIGDLAELINEIVGNCAGIEQVLRRTWDQIPKRCACIEKARTELCYDPVIGLEEGLARYWSWYAERREFEGVLRG